MILIKTRYWLRRRQVFHGMVSRHSLRLRLRRMLFLLFGIILCHAGLMLLFEDMSLWQAIWLTFISATTIGYGDISAQTVLGQISTMLLICGCAIWVLGQMTGDWFDYRLDCRERKVKGQWEWHGMQDHLVILNTPIHGGNSYLERLVKQVRQTPMLNHMPILVVTDQYPDGLPEVVRDLNVVHRSVAPETLGSLSNVHLEVAAYVLIIARDAYNSVSDSVTLDLLERIRCCSDRVCVVAECVQDKNKARFMRYGADAVMRPIRAYPELVVRAMVAPGTEQILENLFTYQGDSTQRYDISVSQVTWGQIVQPILELGYGTPLGFLDPSGNVVTNPSGDLKVDVSAIYVLVKQGVAPTLEKLQAAMSHLSSNQSVRSDHGS